jgi:hypothetical protein
MPETPGNNSFFVKLWNPLIPMKYFSFSGLSEEKVSSGIPK